MKYRCSVCVDQRFTPCPATAVKDIGVCAYCGVRGGKHRRMPCQSCNKDGDKLDLGGGGFGGLADLFGFGS